MKTANLIAGVTSSMRLVLLVFYGFFSPLLMESRAVPVQQVTANVEIAPFLVLGVGLDLYTLPYTWPEAPDQNVAQLLYMNDEADFIHSVTGISYHYRRRLIFWSTNSGQVNTGSFTDRTKLTNVKKLQVLIGRPWEFQVVADLAVDWLNDKLYWTLQNGGKIEELDLETDQRRIVVQSEGAAAFNGLVVYPYPDHGWLFWTDNEAGKIERVIVNGEGRKLVRGGLGKCIWPLEIDYSKQTVYWVNTCQRALRSLQIGDSEQSVDTVTIDSSFSGTRSITLFDSVLYWNEGVTVKATNKSIDSGDIVQIYQVSESLSATIEHVAVELVHAGKQPQEEEFLDIIHETIDKEMLNETCPVCVHGYCVPPGRCVCNNGWTGENCTTDIDECALARDGCDYECHNTPGSFYCSCNSSSSLNSDGRTCILVSGSPTTTYVIDPTVSTPGMGIGPEETPPAMLLLPSSTSPVATASPTPIPTTSTSPALSTTSVLSVISRSPALPTLTSTAFATQSPFTPSSVVSGPRQTSTTASETTPSDTDSSTDPLPGAMEPSSGMTLIIIASAAAGACVLLIIVVIIMIAAVVHYASRRCGSYTVNPDPAKGSGAPSWTPAVVQTSATVTNGHVNGHSNGHSYQTKSFQPSSPTCSTKSFT